LQQQLNEPAVQPIPLHHDIAAALSDSAVSTREKELLTQVRKKLMEITLETCVSCHEKWFDLDVNAAGKCQKCSKSGKFSAENVMDPGSVPPELPTLTQMEEILISPVHALTQVWQIHSGQYAYCGHICNFLRDSAILHEQVPLLPEECEVVIFR
jgi:glutamine synthetase type III